MKFVTSMLFDGGATLKTPFREETWTGTVRSWQFFAEPTAARKEVAATTLYFIVTVRVDVGVESWTKHVSTGGPWL